MKSKTSDDYINEILLWCDVITQCNIPSQTTMLSVSEQKARHRAIVSLHFTMLEYLSKNGDISRLPFGTV